MRRYKISVCLLKNGAARNGLQQWEGQRDKQDTSPRSCDILLAICNLFWLGPTTSEELEEEVARSSSLLTGR